MPVNGRRPRGEGAGWRPTFEALVRATCPPQGSDDDLVEAAAADAEGIVGSLAPGTRGAVLGLMGLLEHAARLRGRPRFSRLEAPVATEVFAAYRRGPLGALFGLLRDLVVVAFYEQPAVRAAVGYLPDPFIAERTAARLERFGRDIEDHRRLLVRPAPLRPPVTADAARPEGRLRHGSALPERVECDVVIVGSGAGGGVMAAELAEAGLAVVVLEEGDHHDTASFTTSTIDALATLYRDGGVTTTVGRPPVGYAEGRCVGGGTVVNGGMAFRAPEHILERWAAASGDRSLARGGLDEAYERVERFLSVGLPDPGSAGRDQELLRRGAERLGWRVVQDTRNHVHCGGCNVCTWGCPTGAKQSTLVSYLPRAMHFGADVWHGCRVDRVTMAGKRATGVSGTVGAGPQGPARRFEVRSRRVVVGAGALQTPALLQRSGICAPSGGIGRHLAVHPGAAVVAEFDEDVEGWKGAHQSLQVREFEDEGIVLAAVNLPPSLVARSLRLDGAALGEVLARYNRLVLAGVLVEDTGTGRVRALGSRGVVATYPVTDDDARRVTRAVLLLGEALLEAGATTVHLPFAGRGPLRGGDDLRRARAIPVRARDLTLSTVHLMGTARMGTDPTGAVCDPFGEVFDTAGLSVTDASLFPGPVGVNPMLTIMALATRAAGRIVDRW